MSEQKPEPTFEFETVPPETILQRSDVTTRLEQAKILREIAFDIESGKLAVEMHLMRAALLLNLTVMWHAPGTFKTEQKPLPGE